MFSIEPQNVNDPNNYGDKPQMAILMARGADTAAASILENTTAVTTVMATDPDTGQTLSYSISGGADAGKFTIGSSTGALSFVTAPNFELPTDAGGNNVYDVIVQVSDGHGGIDTQAIAVTVTDVVENTTGGTSDTAYNSTNIYPWTSITYAYDGSNRVDYISVLNDDASRSFIDYDQANAYPWTTAISGYDEQNRLDFVTIKMDAGNTYFTDYDQTNTRPWMTAISGYDAQDRLDFVTIKMDAGNTYFTDYDQANSGPWMMAISGYDAKDRLDYVTIADDDGTLAYTDYDQANESEVQYDVYYYDAGKSLVHTFIQYDDGHTFFV